MAYADYYECSLTNDVLNIQICNEPGIMIYMLPQEAGSSKVVTYHGWGAKYDSFYCCYGIGNIFNYSQVAIWICKWFPLCLVSEV